MANMLKNISLEPFKPTKEIISTSTICYHYNTLSLLKAQCDSTNSGGFMRGKK